MQTTKNSLTMATIKVKPNEDVTVYSTGLTSHYESGAPITVHAALAEKLIKQGKATKDAPTAKTVKSKD